MVVSSQKPSNEYVYVMNYSKLSSAQKNDFFLKKEKGFVAFNMLSINLNLSGA